MVQDSSEAQRPFCLPQGPHCRCAACQQEARVPHCRPRGEASAASLDRKGSASHPQAWAHPGAFSLVLQALVKKESSLPNKEVQIT